MRLALSLTLLAAAFVSQAVAADLETIMRDTDALVAAPTGIPACFPDFKGPADVFSIAAYEGAEMVDRGSSGHAISRTTVHIGATANPVLVLATAYESTIWSFTLDPGAKLAGIMLSGYYQPMVEGVPDGTPVGRSYYGEVNQHTPPKRCGVTLSAEQQEAITQQIKAQRATQRQLASAQSRKSDQALDYDQFVRDLSEKGADPAALTMARSIASAAADEAKAAMQATLAAGAALSALEGQLNGPPVKRLPDVYFYVNDRTDLGRLAGQIARLGPYAFVSSQYVYRASAVGFEISEAIAVADKQSRADATAALANLRPPPANLLPADAPRLVAPINLGPDEGLQYLVDHGYAAIDPAWTKYICNLRTAVARAKGLDGNPCGEMYGPYLVLLGPITYPAGLYGAHRGQFILPDGVAAPDGEPGHSETIRPADILAGKDRRN